MKQGVLIDRHKRSFEERISPTHYNFNGSCELAIVIMPELGCRSIPQFRAPSLNLFNHESSVVQGAQIE